MNDNVSVPRSKVNEMVRVLEIADDLLRASKGILVALGEAAFQGEILRADHPACVALRAAIKRCEP